MTHEALAQLAEAYLKDSDMTSRCPCGALFSLNPKYPHRRFCRPGRQGCIASRARYVETDARFRRRHPDYNRIWVANYRYGGPGERPCDGILP